MDLHLAYVRLSPEQEVALNTYRKMILVITNDFWNRIHNTTMTCMYDQVSNVSPLPLPESPASISAL